MYALFSYFNLYLGVAKAFNDTTFLHPEMEELIRMYFKDVNEATLKLGQVRVHSMYFRYPNPKIKNSFEYGGTQHRLQK